MKKLEFITKHSIHIVILLLLLLTGGSVGVGILLQTNPFIESIDGRLYTEIAGMPHSYFLDLLVLPFNFNFLPYVPLSMPSYLYFYVGGGLFLIWIFNRKLFLWAFFAVCLGTVLAYTVTMLDWLYVFRQRPFVNLPNNVDEYAKNIWVTYSSFPSGHARETALYSVIIYNFLPVLKWFLIGFTIFIMFSRIYMGAHYPSDVVAGALIGYLTARMALIISREIQIIVTSRKDKSHAAKPKKK